MFVCVGGGGKQHAYILFGMFFLQVVCLAPWMQNATDGLEKDLALAVVEMEAKVNDLVFWLALSHKLCSDSTPRSDKLTQAKHLALLRNCVKLCASWLEKAPHGLREAPLIHSVAFYKQWTSVVGCFAEGLSEKLFDSAVADLRGASERVDTLCPSWGNSVNDNEFKEDSAKLQLVISKSIVALPQQVRQLWNQMTVLAALGAALGYPSVDTYEGSESV